MIRKRAIIFTFIILIPLQVAYCREEEKMICKGKVVDSQGQPVSGAKVSLYKFIVQREISTFDVELVRVTTTKDDGIFSFEFDGQSAQLSFPTVVLVEKEGFALGWANWYLESGKDALIALGPPVVLAGKVIDGSGGPVNEAEVEISMLIIKDGDQIQFLTGKVCKKLLICKTDALGRFKFEKIPSEAAAEFVVRKAGLATVGTFDEKKSEQMQLQYKAGREDIEITLPIEAKIEGTVIEKESGNPVPGVKLVALQQNRQPSSGNEPVTSGEDGTFTIDALCPGKHVIRAMLSEEEAGNWIISPVEVDVEAGRTTTQVKVELTKGGVIEIVVTESGENKPVEGAFAYIMNIANKEVFNGTTGKDGILRKRLAPGQYQIMQMHKQDFQYEHKKRVFTIEDGKTNRVEIQLKGYPKIAGKVLDEEGAPVSGAVVSFRPSYAEQAITDSEGAFVIRLKNPSMLRSQSSEETIHIIVRHKERNLAVAVQLDEKMDNLEIKMAPGVIFSGKVVDVNSAGMPNAKISLTFWASDYGYGSQEPTEIDSDGNFEIRAIPMGYKYDINADADGYGRRYVRANTSEAEDDHMELEPLVLNVANLSVSGVVVDEFDKPVSKIRVYAYGNGQKDGETHTDEQGKFTLENVCKGPIRIQASSRKPKWLYGHVAAEGGATDIRIVVEEHDSSGRPVSKQPPSLLNKTLPELKEFGVNLSPADVNDKKILVCFFDYQQRPSRNCITQLSKRAQELKEKGIVVIIVQASKIEQSKLDEWVKNQDIAFPVGMIEADQEKTRFAWGIKSLPWLILTDKQHIVRSQGFSIAELDKNITETDKTNP